MGCSTLVVNGRGSGSPPCIFDDQQAAHFLDRHRESIPQILNALGKRGRDGSSHRLFGDPSRHGNGVRAGKGQESHRPQPSRFGQQVELHPGALVAAARRAPEYPGARQLPHASRRLEITARQFVVAAPRFVAVHPGVPRLGTFSGRVPAISRRRLTAWDRTAMAVSMSRSVVVRPSPNRRLLSLRRSLRPRARSTYEGSPSEELHADPVDTARCGRTAASRLSPSTPSNDTLSRCGTECVALPLRSTPPMAARPCHRRRCKHAIRAVSTDDVDAARSKARPIPTTWCVARVPALKARSCPPPYSRGASCTCAPRGPSLRSDTSRAPTPFGPYTLCPDRDMRSTPSPAKSTGHLPTLCAASTCSQALPWRAQIAAMALTSWTTPISLLTCMIETSTVSVRSAAAT